MENKYQSFDETQGTDWDTNESGPAEDIDLDELVAQAKGRTE